MQTSEYVRVLLFLSAVSTLYILSAGILLRKLLRRNARKPQPALSVPRRWTERTILLLALIGLLCVAYGYFVEPYWPEVTHVHISSSNLKQGSNPIRVVHISDLHSDPKTRLEDRLPDIIAGERPDLIVFTGDAVNSPDGLQPMRNCLTGLAKIAPTFAVRGNWDSWYRGEGGLFEGTGVEDLNGFAREVNVGTSAIWVAGVDVGGEDNPSGINHAFESIPHGACTLFLYHYPDLIHEIAMRPDVDLYCAGHTHGGQVALPLYGALVTLSRFGKRYESGLYRIQKTWLYVNRGIGMEGGPAPRVRFCARPEVTVIDLHPLS